MNNRKTLSFVLNGHSPFIRHPELQNPSQEIWFFESLSDTYIPLLEVFDRLDRDLVPFRVAISLSPTLCHMFNDEFLINRYLEYTNNQVIFGARELDRTSGDPALHRVVKYFYDRVVEKREFFTWQCENNILKKFDYFHKKGRLEILCTAATNAFLPLFTGCPEAIQAQLEVAITAYRANFGKYPQGFWLPELGWKAEMDSWLRAYNFAYTVLEPHALVYAKPFAEKGSFFPARTPQGIIVLGRDFYAAENMAESARDPVFRCDRRDQGYELPPDSLGPFLGNQSSRTCTGYKYWALGEDGSGKVLYDPVIAGEKAKNYARSFLAARFSRLREAVNLMDENVISLCAFDADSFGRFWYEGPQFIETLLREGTRSDEAQILTPAEYICKLDSSSLQTLVPEFSSWGPNGYAETWLDASNDWIYRHTMRAIERMTELVERFPDNTGLKERALNQATREIMLVLESDWTKMLYKQDSADYARMRLEGSLRNFTTIYEALGSNYISTEWLTILEKRHNIFPNINYKVFRRKR